MGDRELLELAAKAHGAVKTQAGMHFVGHDQNGPIRDWNPLTDDGDALRLAVKLAALRPGASFEVSISRMHDGRGFASAEFFSRDGTSNTAVEADIAAATRRAIVRAAAEIGRAMK